MYEDAARTFERVIGKPHHQLDAQAHCQLAWMYLMLRDEKIHTVLEKLKSLDPKCANKIRELLDR